MWTYRERHNRAAFNCAQQAWDQPDPEPEDEEQEDEDGLQR
ncbi:hypothetical protein [Pseudomonas aeruginosa]